MTDTNNTRLAAGAKTLRELDDLEQRELAARVSDNYRLWKEARRPLEDKWQECWEAYLCDLKSLYAQPESELSFDRSRIARPVLYEAVEAIHSHLLNAMFPANERFFSVIPKTEEDRKTRASSKSSSEARSMKSALRKNTPSLSSRPLSPATR